jgi:hypothetical protein
MLMDCIDGDSARYPLFPDKDSFQKKKSILTTDDFSLTTSH